MTLETTLASIPPRDAECAARVKDRLERLAMPRWALGRMLDLAVDVAAIRGEDRPDVSRRVIAIAAGDHGVAAEGVTNFPQSFTGTMMVDFLGGGAGINALASASSTDILLADFGVKHVPPAVAAWERFRDVSVGKGTASFLRGPAMTRAQARQAVENGIRLADGLADAGYGVIGLGELGIGNTTPSAAIVACVTGQDPRAVTGRGTGLSDEQLAHKADVVARGLEVNRPDPKDGLDLLAKVGGFEIAGMAGICLGAAARRVPVVLDGLITTAGALAAAVLAPHARDAMVASHLSAEPGHRFALAHLGLTAYLDLGLRLGEGTGAAIMMNLVASSAAILAKMKTFEELGL
ncbi:MAG: nicotinate-nucleotide--dimethylbenzimidazole phosphoribosyltransferase [Kiritimatiellia bacterium]|jgi:nicotinate-nucleotide--dimethylbenzimidazole phosphoribosyltransferase